MGRIHESAEQATYDELVKIRKALEALLTLMQSVIHKHHASAHGAAHEGIWRSTISMS